MRNVMMVTSRMEMDAPAPAETNVVMESETQLLESNVIMGLLTPTPLQMHPDLIVELHIVETVSSIKESSVITAHQEMATTLDNVEKIVQSHVAETESSILWSCAISELKMDLLPLVLPLAYLFVEIPSCKPEKNATTVLTTTITQIPCVEPIVKFLDVVTELSIPPSTSNVTTVESQTVSALQIASNCVVMDELIQTNNVIMDAPTHLHPTVVDQTAHCLSAVTES